MMKNKSFITIWTFTRVNTKRFFRDKLAIFFGVLFPLIFLFVFGGIFGGNSGDISFKVGVLNKSSSEFSQQFSDQLSENKVFDVDVEVTSDMIAKDKMKKSQLDATIILPETFGEVSAKSGLPTGEATVLYTQNNEQAARTINAILGSMFESINAELTQVEKPLTVSAEQSNEKSLSQFDYVFAGLLGFSILGIGIFGPINVFPELKKQGILRRLSTTPLRVWQYFVSTMLSQVIIGLFTLAIFFAVAMTVFDLTIVGNIFEMIAFLILSIIVILGIGLAVGGWAQNERQAAPLGNIIVFPMMFLSGTFFPRYIMPEWVQNVSDYLPLTPVIEGVRLIITEGAHLVDIWQLVALMLGWTLVIYVIAFRVFRWE